jgi:cytochrome P450
MAVSKGQRLPSLFSTTDESYHANLRRSVNSAFSMSALVQYEPFVDEVTRVFLDQTDRLFAARHKVCNFAEWLQYYAFDVIGQITYSRRHGFVDRAEDVDGMIAYLGKLFSYVAPVSTLDGLTAWRLKEI